MSSPYTQGMKAIQLAKENKQLSPAEFTAARDLLLVKFTILTGTRPGPLNNVTLEDYTTAKVEGDKRIILVAKHKRSKDGPAILGMDKELQDLMSVYVKRIRPQFASSDEECLFIKEDGKGFTKGTIGRRLNSFWKKSGVRAGENIAHVNIHKFVSTQTQEFAPEEVENVSRVMSHSRQTAQRSYVRHNLTKLGAHTMDVIQRVSAMKPSSQSLETATENEPMPKSAASNNSEKKLKQATASVASMRQEQPVAEVASRGQEQLALEVESGSEEQLASEVESSSQEEVETEEAPSSQVQPAVEVEEESKEPSLVSGKAPLKPSPGSSTYAVSEPVTTPSKGLLSEKEKECTQKVFANDIAKKKTLPLEQVRKKCCTNATLALIINSRKRVKAIMNHLSYLNKKAPMVDPTELEKASTSSRINSCLDLKDAWSERTVCRQEWSDEDTEIIKNRFKDFKVLPCAATIKGVFNYHPDLFVIYQRKTWRKIYDKVKNTFKQRK